MAEIPLWHDHNILCHSEYKECQLSREIYLSEHETH